MAFIHLDASNAAMLDFQIQFVWNDDDLFVLLDGKHLAGPADDTRDGKSGAQRANAVAGHESGKYQREAECQNERPSGWRGKEYCASGNVCLLFVVDHLSTISQLRKQ